MYSWEPIPVDSIQLMKRIWGGLMVLAISLIKAVPDREKIVYHSLKELDGVRNIYHLFGDHDLLLILEAENRNELKKMLDHVEETRFANAVKTMLVAPAEGYQISAVGVGCATSAAG
jgi:DNA-binding Lrp family transcriptional regulator